MIEYTETIWREGGEHQAVRVTWGEIEALLGRAHEGTPGDDRRIVDALLASGAPAWASQAEGRVDSDGWYLISR